MSLYASRLTNLAQTYTPGTVADQATQNGSTGPNPRMGVLSQSTPGLAPRIPVLGVLVIVAVLLLLEHRRLRLGGR